MIRFRYAVLTVLAVSSAAAIWMATSAQFFDDKYVGHLLVNGKEVNVKADLRVGNNLIKRNPLFDLKLSSTTPDEAIAAGAPRNLLSNTFNACQVSGYDDTRDEGTATIKVQFNPATSHNPMCNQAVIKMSSFGAMNVVFRNQQGGTMELQVEREYARNPIILATEWVSYTIGKRADHFY